MTDEQKEMCDFILNHYGFENQREILVEEAAELIQAVSKVKRSNERTTLNFIEELADVEVMLEQMKQGLSDKEFIEFLAIQNSKINRQISRIKGVPERNCTNCVLSKTSCEKPKSESGYCGDYRPFRKKRG